MADKRKADGWKTQSKPAPTPQPPRQKENQMASEATTSSTALSGMTAICTYVGRSEKTVLDWIRLEGLPASKIGGAWESDKILIDDWRRQRIVSGPRDEHLRERTR